MKNKKGQSSFVFLRFHGASSKTMCFLLLLYLKEVAKWCLWQESQSNIASYSIIPGPENLHCTRAWNFFRQHKTPQLSGHTSHSTVIVGNSSESSPIWLGTQRPASPLCEAMYEEEDTTMHPVVQCSLIITAAVSKLTGLPALSNFIIHFHSCFENSSFFAVVFQIVFTF